MRKFEKLEHVGAVSAIWILILLGVLVAILVPFLATELAHAYSAYTHDFWIIVLLLSTPVALAEIMLAIILILLNRIRADRIFSAAAHNWVRALSVIAAALSASFVAILIWLNMKNTLPPLLGIILMIGVFVPLAVAAVTKSMLSLLRRATKAREELEGVV